MFNSKKLSPFIWPLVVLVIAFGAFYLKPWQVKPTQTISVSASGTTQTTPNVAKITASIESKNQNIDQARKENADKVSNIVDKLKTLGVDQKDIKTQNISAGQAIEPMIYPAPPRPTTNAFSTSLEITLRNFDKTDQVLTTLTQNGATNLYGPNLTVDDQTLENAKSQARANAVANAKSKAKELATAAGRNVGSAVKIQEQGDYAYPMPMMAVGGADLREKASQIQPGENEVSISVQVDFELK